MHVHDILSGFPGKRGDPSRTEKSTIKSFASSFSVQNFFNSNFAQKVLKFYLKFQKKVQKSSKPLPNCMYISGLRKWKEIKDTRDVQKQNKRKRKKRINDKHFKMTGYKVSLYEKKNCIISYSSSTSTSTSSFYSWKFYFLLNVRIIKTTLY